MLSTAYHDIFDYPLVKSDFPRWRHTSDTESIKGITSTKSIKRLKRERISKEKLKIAKKAGNLLSKIPSVKFVGVTGALAMMNADKNSDIDLLIITKRGTLWTTRLICSILLTGKTRRAGSDNEKDKLCLNMWLDEDDLIWDKLDRNLYTAHEIAQVVPLVNKNKIYEKFLYLNKWILDFWPNSVKIVMFSDKNIKLLAKNSNLIEMLAFKLQYWYMKSKITRETITKTRAIFHPNDWGKVVMKKLSS